jgi:RNA polymerase sigma-70 factor (ECF subfamily)
VALHEESGSDQLQLADRLRSGDPAASRELVVRFRRGVAVILRRCGVQAAEIEDLGQEVFRIVLDKVRQGVVREPERLPGYVAAVARNLGIEAGRQASLRAARDGGEALAEVASGAASPLDRLVERDQVALVRRVLDELGTERDRVVLRRIYLSGDDRDEVGRDLGLDPIQLNQVLHRARQRYRALYEQAQRGETSGSRA